MARFVEIDNCPVPAKLEPAIRKIKQASGASLNSAYRGSDPQGVAILRQNGKMSQKELYDGFVAGRPNFNPANKPGRSTHELRNDGVAYPGPAGMPLRYWQQGLDWTGSVPAVEAAKRAGFIMTVTYPGNPREGHHTNFRKEPRVKLPLKPLRKGMSGRRVADLNRRLAFVRSPHDGKPYLQDEKARHSRYFGEATERALKRFQREHGHKGDGIYGPQSHQQLLASVRYRKRKNAISRRRKAR